MKKKLFYSVILTVLMLSVSTLNVSYSAASSGKIDEVKWNPLRMQCFHREVKLD